MIFLFDWFASALTLFQPMGALRIRNVSGVNAAQQFDLDIRNLKKTLAIHMTCSAGTATLAVSVSADNSNWLTLDSIATAATIIKQYTEATVGAGIALSPLAFRYLRISVGAAGAGNTTTLTVGLK